MHVYVQTSLNCLSNQVFIDFNIKHSFNHRNSYIDFDNECKSVFTQNTTPGQTFFGFT